MTSESRDLALRIRKIPCTSSDGETSSGVRISSGHGVAVVVRNPGPGARHRVGPKKLVADVPPPRRLLKLPPPLRRGDTLREEEKQKERESEDEREKKEERGERGVFLEPRCFHGDGFSLSSESGSVGV